MVKWLELCASIAKGKGLIPGQGIKIPQAIQCNQKKKKTNPMNCKFGQQSRWQVLPSSISLGSLPPASVVEY